VTPRDSDHHAASCRSCGWVAPLTCRCAAASSLGCPRQGARLQRRAPCLSAHAERRGGWAHMHDTRREGVWRGAWRGGRRREDGWQSHVHFPTLQPAALRAFVLDHAHANWGATYLGNLGKAPCGSEVDPAKGLKVETSTKSAQRPNSDRIGGIDSPEEPLRPQDHAYAIPTCNCTTRVFWRLPHGEQQSYDEESMPFFSAHARNRPPRRLAYA